MFWGVASRGGKMGWTRRLVAINALAIAIGATLVTTASAQAVASTAVPVATPPRPALGAPAALATADGHVQVFAIGGGTIWQNWQDPTTGAHGDWVGEPS